MPQKRNPSTAPEESAAPGDHPLSPNEILIAEFEYAANSAFQANEDRSKVASFFLVSVGSLVAGIFSAQEFGLEAATSLALAGIFAVVTILGLLTVMQLARLREAWTDSAEAMNKVKDYYIGRFGNLKLEGAFRWRTHTIPKRYKPRSVSYYTVFEVALLSALTFGAFAYFLQTGIGYTTGLWAFTPAAGALAFTGELFIYKRMLADKKGKK
jgi:hypothetical protein